MHIAYVMQHLKHMKELEHVLAFEKRFDALFYLLNTWKCSTTYYF